MGCKMSATKKYHLGVRKGRCIIELEPAKTRTEILKGKKGEKIGERKITEGGRRLILTTTLVDVGLKLPPVVNLTDEEVNRVLDHFEANGIKENNYRFLIVEKVYRRKNVERIDLKAAKKEADKAEKKAEKKSDSKN